jgi:hypothetical protein
VVSASTSVIEEATRQITDLQEKFESFSSSVCARLDRLNAVCSTRSSSGEHCRQLASLSDGGDRQSNTVIFGVMEDRDASIWHFSVENALHFVLDPAFDTFDICRLGHCGDTQRKPRLVLVMLHVARDRRIILSRRSKLKQHSERGIFIALDELIEARYKNMFERLKYRENMQGKGLMLSMANYA